MGLNRKAQGHVYFVRSVLSNEDKTSVLSSRKLRNFWLKLDCIETDKNLEDEIQPEVTVVLTPAVWTFHFGCCVCRQKSPPR